MEEKIFLYTYRYMWKTKDSDRVQFQYVTDTLERLQSYEENILSISDLESAGKEYISQIDVSQVAFFNKIFGGVKNEESKD